MVKRRTELTKKKAEIGVFDGKVDGGEDRGCCLEITHFWLQMNNEQTMMILIIIFLGNYDFDLNTNDNIMWHQPISNNYEITKIPLMRVK